MPLSILYVSAHSLSPDHFLLSLTTLLTPHILKLIHHPLHIFCSQHLAELHCVFSGLNILQMRSVNASVFWMLDEGG